MSSSGVRLDPALVAGALEEAVPGVITDFYEDQVVLRDEVTGKVSDADLPFRLSEAALTGLVAGTFGAASKFGAAKRRATTLLMSTFDTDAAAASHDAVFDAALAACKDVLAAGYGLVQLVLDSRAEYTLSRAPAVGANGQHAQVAWPFSRTISGTIELVGMPGGMSRWTSVNGGQRTVIRCGLNAAPAFDATKGIASMIGGPASYYQTNRGFAGQSHIWMSLRDITFRAADPKICGVDAGYLGGFFAPSTLDFDTDFFANLGGDYPITTLVPCTNVQACPLITPLIDAYLGSEIETLTVSGWATGPVIGELVNAKTIRTFYTAGAAINVDVAYHTSYIGVLGDFNNRCGIAAYYPAPGFLSYSIAHWADTNVTGPASQKQLSINILLATPLEIPVWNVQTDAGQSGRAEVQRLWDIWDEGSVIPVDATWNRIDAGVGIVVGGLKVAPDSNAGNIPRPIRARIRDRCRPPGPQIAPPAIPASGVAIRNPFVRDALLTIVGGTYTVVRVNGELTSITSATPGPVIVPACATVSITYSVAPTSWSWLTI